MRATDNTTAPPQETIANRAKSLMSAGRFSAALDSISAGLTHTPQDRDLLYMRAVCRRYLGDPAAALLDLDALAAAHPDYARGQQERGHCHRSQGDPAAAVAAYERAVAQNPTLAASWRALAGLYSQAASLEDQARVAASLAYLDQLPPPLVGVADLLHEGELYKAESLCRSFLLENADHIEGMRLLAAIGVRLNVLDDAEFLLESCVALAPEHDAARHDYVNALHRRQKYAEAFRQADRLRAANPGNRRFEVLYANQCVALGRYEPALAIYDRVLQDLPDDPQMHLARGNALKIMGRSAEAVEAYRASARAPGNGEAYWSLSNMKTYRFTQAEIEDMQRWEQSEALAAADRSYVSFALGKACEDRGAYAEAFAHYERGNALKAAASAYFPEFMERDLRLQAEICTPELFTKLRGAGCDRPDPIFIVGLPRSGSTLLEQILSSHSLVDGTLELPNVLATAFSLDRRRRVNEEPSYPRSLQDLSAAQVTALGEKYIEDTKVFRAGAPHFVDKMPNNFRHIGLIKLMLPRSKIIDARRDPMACGFSCFKQLFVEGQEFTYDLANLGRYYRNYLDLMAHWDRTLPGEVLRVQYEDVVDDLETNVRRILAFCGLPFEPQCLEFYKTRRSVRTASAEQVRQPIYRDEVDQWRNFEPYLAPLRAALAEGAAAQAMTSRSAP